MGVGRDSTRERGAAGGGGGVKREGGHEEVVRGDGNSPVLALTASSPAERAAGSLVLTRPRDNLAPGAGGPRRAAAQRVARRARRARRARALYIPGGRGRPGAKNWEAIN